MEKGTEISDNDNNSVDAATMNGNIVVIFIVWLGGVIISVMCVMVECKRIIRRDLPWNWKNVVVNLNR